MADKTTPDLDIFNDIATAKGGYVRNYLKKGNYILEVLTVTFDVGSQDQIPFFAVDMKVRQSSCPDHKVDDVVNWVVKRDPKYKELFLTNVRNFIVGVLSGINGEAVAENTVTKDVVADVSKDRGEFVRGVYVECSVQDAKPGKKFMPHIFSMSSSQPEHIMAMREAVSQG